MALESHIAQIAIAKAQAAKEAREDPEIDPTTLSLTAQEKLQAAIRQHQRKLAAPHRG